MSPWDVVTYRASGRFEEGRVMVVPVLLGLSQHERCAPLPACVGVSEEGWQGRTLLPLPPVAIAQRFGDGFRSCWLASQPLAARQYRASRASFPVRGLPHSAMLPVRTGFPDLPSPFQGTRCRWGHLARLHEQPSEDQAGTGERSNWQSCRIASSIEKPKPQRPTWQPDGGFLVDLLLLLVGMSLQSLHRQY